MTERQTDPVFTDLRPGLTRLAYRMLGSVADAEDIVQEAYLRWLGVNPTDIREPAAFLRTIVTRLCLNLLKSARRQRETYIGPWLPEPVFEPDETRIDDNITLPLMIALERLSPLERAAFLLHDVFGMGFNEIALVIDRETATCRKLASRARQNIHAARPRFSVPKDQGMKIASAFFTASRTGDLQALRDLLADDVAAYADGGGRVPATPVPLTGISAVMQRHMEMAEGFAQSPSRLVRFAMIDGLPGFITIEAGNILQTTALQIERGRITALYVTRNPDKLGHLAHHRTLQ